MKHLYLYILLACIPLFLLSSSTQHPADPFVTINQLVPFVDDPDYFYTADTSSTFILFLAYKSDILTLENMNLYEKLFIKLVQRYNNLIFVRSYSTFLKAPGTNILPSAPDFDYSQYPVLFIIYDNEIKGTLKGFKTEAEITAFIVATIQANS